jgi:hypothetical protein
MIGAGAWSLLKGKPMELFRCLDVNGLRKAQQNGFLDELGLPPAVVMFLVENHFLSSG